jgi:hypothetical protein
VACMRVNVQSYVGKEESLRILSALWLPQKGRLKQERPESSITG